MISNVAGLIILLGLVLLIAMIWQGVAITGEAARQEVSETLNRTVERLRILVRSAEMTAESVERVSRMQDVTGATLRSALESSLAAFEQRPELSYLGIILPETGEYGNLERTADGKILLWLFPGTRRDDPMTRNFLLTDQGFTLHDERPSDGYDPRNRPFYLAALGTPAEGTWIPTYQWVVHSANSEPLWGFSYVKAVRDSSGRPVCVLDTDFDMPALNSFLKSLAAGNRCKLHIVELGKTPRVIGGPNVARAPLPPSGDIAALIKSSGEAFVDRMDLDGERQWVAARRIDLTGGVTWLVIASRKDTLIETPLRRQLYQVAGAGLALAGGLVLVSVRMANRFGRPLAELEQRVADIERHGPEAASAPVPSATDEFRETQLLGAALDRMAEAVRQMFEAEEQKVASLALKAAIFDSTSTAIFTIDSQRTVLDWNAAAERLFGTERGHVLGRDVAEAVRAPDGPADWAAILGTTDAGTFRFVGAGGPFDGELRLVALNQDGREIRTLVIHDISERKSAEQQLLAFNAELEQRVAHRTRELQILNKELESFCYSVSHDLRAPLRGIAGFAEILTKSHAASLDDKARNYLDRIVAATDRMGDLIDDLLNLSRVSRDGMRRENVDLSAMALDILAHLQHAAPERRVEAVVEDGLSAEGDSRLLRIMLENLLGNAWKFTSKTPVARITFAAAQGEDGAPAFAVSDNGAGFDMRYANKLFGPFQRLHRATEFPGTGIGLATVQRIIHRHGGHISAHAEPGKGATFHFSLAPSTP